MDGGLHVVVDRSATTSSAPGFDRLRLRRLATDFVGQVIVLSRREPGRLSTIRLLGSRLRELNWLATELEERLWAGGEGRVAVEVAGDSIAAPIGTYCIDVDYFLRH
jgi:hypothetical protein